MPYMGERIFQDITQQLGIEGKNQSLEYAFDTARLDDLYISYES